MQLEWMAEFFRYRELFYFLVWRDVKVRYKQTLLGAAWAILQPVCMMVVFTLFFGRSGQVDTGGVPYPVFSYAALVPWTYFQYAFPLTGNSLISNSKLISKVYFPRAIVPAASALSGAVDFFIAAVIMVALMLYYHVPLTAGLLLWPLLLLPLVMFTTALGITCWPLSCPSRRSNSPKRARSRNRAFSEVPVNGTPSASTCRQASASAPIRLHIRSLSTTDGDWPVTRAISQPATSTFGVR